jgi:hypothetical protein
VKESGNKPPDHWAEDRPPSAEERNALATTDEWKARLVKTGVNLNGATPTCAEAVFIERMTRAGEHIEWLPKGKHDAHGFIMSSLDFKWNGADWELKSPGPTKPPRALAGQIRKCQWKARTNHGITKDHFMIDLGDTLITSAWLRVIADYNLSADIPIRELWVHSRGSLHKIQMR